MIPTISTAISGFNLAAERIKVSAENLANQQSTSRVEAGKRVDEPYVPQRVEALSDAGGGVRPRVVDKQPATIQTLSAEGELIALPNVDTAEELMNTQTASYDAKANLAVIRASNNMQQSLLDIFV